MALVYVASADNSSTKLDTFIPRVITHSLKRSPQGSTTSRTRERIAPNSRASLSCHHAPREPALNYGPAGHTAVPDSLDSPISLPCECYSPDPATSDRSKDPDLIFLHIAFFVTHKRKSIRERIMVGRSNATDYYVETTALDIH